VYFGNQWSLDEAVIPALAISSAALVLISYIPKSD
jgi:SSS family solute:Na+ symporter